MLSRRDVADLEKALAIGQFEKSVMGAILDRAELFSKVDRRVRASDVSARPTAEVRYQPRSEPDSYLLEVYGRASRKLSRLAKVDPEGAAALVAYHGDAGARWGRGDFGRIGALLHLTNAGKRLVKKTMSRGAKLQLSDEQRIEVELDVRMAQMRRRAELSKGEHRSDEGCGDGLVAEAIAEATALYQRACDRWCEANGAEQAA